MTRIIQEKYSAKKADLGGFYILYMHSQSKMTENGVFPGCYWSFNTQLISELVNIETQVAPKPQKDVLSLKYYNIWVLLISGVLGKHPKPKYPYITSHSTEYLQLYSELVFKKNSPNWSHIYPRYKFVRHRVLACLSHILDLSIRQKNGKNNDVFFRRRYLI